MKKLFIIFFIMIVFILSAQFQQQNNQQQNNQQQNYQQNQQQNYQQQNYQQNQQQNQQQNFQQQNYQQNQAQQNQQQPPPMQQNQGTETIVEITSEKDLAERIERLLEPFAGKSIVTVDLTLKYPDKGVQLFGTELNMSESLPGIPVARSAGALSEGDEEDTKNQIEIISKRVTIYLSRRISQKKVKLIEDSVIEWLNITPARGDLLIIKKVLTITNKYLIFYIVIGAILLFFLINFRSSVRFLGYSMRNINIKGFDNAIHVKGNVPIGGGAVGGGGAATASSESKIKSPDVLFTPEKPFPIEIIEKEEKEREQTLSFHFLENLSLQNFAKLAIDEEYDDVAFILSNLSLDYIQRFFSQFPSEANLLIRSMVKNLQRTKSEIEEIKAKFFKKYGTTRFCMVKGLISLNKKELRFDNFQIHKILLQLF